MSSFNVELSELTAQINAIDKATERFSKTVSQNTVVLNSMSEAIRGLKDPTKTIEERFAAYQSCVEKASAVNSAYEESVKSIGDSIKKEEELIAALADARDKSMSGSNWRETANLSLHIDKENESIQRRKAVLGELLEAQRVFSEKYALGTDEFDSFAMSVDYHGLKGEYESLGEELSKLNDKKKLGIEVDEEEIKTIEKKRESILSLVKANEQVNARALEKSGVSFSLGYGDDESAHSVENSTQTEDIEDIRKKYAGESFKGLKNIFDSTRDKIKRLKSREDVNEDELSQLESVAREVAMLIDENTKANAEEFKSTGIPLKISEGDIDLYSDDEYRKEQERQVEMRKKKAQRDYERDLAENSYTERVDMDVLDASRQQVDNGQGSSIGEKEISNNLDEIREKLTSIKTESGESIFPWVKSDKKRIEDVKSELETLDSAQKKINENAKNISKGISDRESSIGMSEAEVRDKEETMSTLKDGGEIQKAKEDIDNIKKSIEQQKEELQKLGEDLIKNSELSVEAKNKKESKETEMLSLQVDDITSDESKNPFKVNTKGIDELNTKLAELNSIDEQLNKRGEEFSANIGAQENSIKSLKKELEEEKKVATSWFSTKEEKGKAEENIKKLTAELKNEEDELKRLNKEQEKNNKLKERVSKSKSVTEKNITNRGGVIDKEDTDVAAKGIDKVTKSTSSLNQSMALFGRGVGQVKRGFAQLASGGSRASEGFGMMAQGIGNISKSMLKLMANPFVLMIAVVTAAVVELTKRIKYLASNTTEGKEGFADFLGTIRGVMNFLNTFIDQVAKKVMEFIISIKDIPSVITGAFDFVKTYATTQFKNLGIIFKNGYDAIKRIFTDGEFDFSGLTKGLESTDAAMEEFQGKLNKYKSNFSDFKMPSLDENITAFKKIKQLELELEKEGLAWILESARIEKEKARLQEEMTTGGQIQKLENIAAQQELINQKYEKELSMARKELQIRKIQNSLTGNTVTVDDKKEEARLTARVNDLEKQRSDELRTAQRSYRSITLELEKQRLSREKTLETYKNDVEVSALRERLKYEEDINKKIQLRAKLREIEHKKMMQQLGQEEQEETLRVLGEKAYDKYRRAVAEGKSREETKKAVMSVLTSDAQRESADEMFSFYDKKRVGEEQKMEQSARQETLSENISAYIAYSNELISIAKWREEQMRNINEGKSQMTVKQVELITEQKQKDAAKNRSIDATEQGMAESAASFAAMITNAFVGDIPQLLENFEKSQDLNYLNGIADMTDEQKNAEIDKQSEILENENSTAEERELAQICLNELLMKEEELRALIEGRENAVTEMRKTATEAMEKNMTKEEFSATMTSKSLGVIADSCDMVAMAARGIGDAFEKQLSKKGKRAVKAISDIASTAGSSVRAIMELIPKITAMAGSAQTTIVTTTTAADGAVTQTSIVATQAISSVEKASVIIAIISAALQVVMAIANALSNLFTDHSAQDAYEDQVEKIEKMKLALQDIDWETEQKRGTDYYKSLAKGAKEAEAIANEQKKAYEQAQEIADNASSGHKGDDEREQAQEAKEAWQDAMDDVKKRYEQLMEELTGTSLDDFASSIAETLIDGFETGIEGANDAWDDFMKDLEKTMMKKALTNALTDMFQESFTKINEMTSNGELTQAEMDLMVDELNSKSEQAKALAQTYYDLMQERGLNDDDDAEGSKGFGQMTQDTAEALNARFTALQMEGANVVQAVQAMQLALTDMQLDVKLQTATMSSLLVNSNLALQYEQDKLDQLMIIAQNTAMLTETNNKLQTIANYTSRL